LLTKWSHRYGWTNRSDLYDRAREEKRQARAEHILNSGNALPENRVKLLNQLLEQLVGDVTTDGLWLRKLVSLRTGQFDYEVHEEETYNRQIISDIRGLLDDISREVGGRTKNQNSVNGLAMFLSKAFKQFDTINPTEPKQLEQDTASRLNEIVLTPEQYSTETL
jgi:hypothetical protein